jgi:hypothetical protein
MDAVKERAVVLSEIARWNNSIGAAQGVFLVAVPAESGIAPGTEENFAGAECQVRGHDLCIAIYRSISGATWQSTLRVADAAARLSASQWPVIPYACVSAVGAEDRHETEQGRLDASSSALQVPGPVRVFSDLGYLSAMVNSHLTLVVAKVCKKGW